MPNPCCLRLVDGPFTSLSWLTDPVSDRNRDNWQGRWDIESQDGGRTLSFTEFFWEPQPTQSQTRSFFIHDVSHHAFGNENFILVLQDVGLDSKILLLVDLDAPANIPRPVTNVFQLLGTQLPTVSGSPNGADYILISGLDDSHSPGIRLVGPKLVRTDNGRALFAGPPNAGATWHIKDGITAHMNAADKSVTLTDSHEGSRSNIRTVNVETGILQIDGSVPYFPTVYIGSDDLNHRQFTAQKTITNIGFDCLHIVSIISSDPAFSISRINGVPASYPVEICPVGFANVATLDILFHPATPGNHTATFTINTDTQHESRDETGHVWQSLRGNTFQVSAYADTASVRIDALTRILDFGNTPSGQTRHGQIVLRNIGEKNCEVTLGAALDHQPFAWDDRRRGLSIGQQAQFDCSFTPPHPGHYATAVDRIESSPSYSVLTYVPQLRGTAIASTTMSYSPRAFLRFVPTDDGRFAARMDIENTGATEILHLGVKVLGPLSNAFNLFVTTREVSPPHPTLHDRHLLAYPHDARNFFLLTIEIIFEPPRQPFGLDQLYRPHAFAMYDHNAVDLPDMIAIPIGF